MRPGFQTFLVILVRASYGKKGNDRQHTEISQDLVKYSYSYPFVRAQISEPFSVALMDRKDRKGNDKQPIRVN